MALNNVSLMGRLVADPELRIVGEDIPVASFRIAVDRDRKNRDGERETDFINISAWRSTANFVSQYFVRGDMIAVKGRIQTRQYTDKEGNNRTAVDVIAEDVYFGGAKKDGGTAPTHSAAQNDAPMSMDDDSLPF